MKSEAYTFSEDSRLLRDALREFSGSTFLEIGAGNGGTLISVSDRFNVVVGTDLVRPAMDDWKKLGASFIVADRASCLRESSFDVVAFNPPYLRGKVVDRAVDGGEKLEVPIKFLEEALRVVKTRGTVLILLNDQADLATFREACAESGFSLERVAAHRAFFEELAIYAARRADA
jgi:release factor glutamine methyltransferase